MAEPLKVLIVEDSENDELLILRALKKSGYQTIHRRVQSASELTDALDRETWDIILSDYSMPQFTGLDALSIVRGRNLDTPFMIISGTIGESVAVRAMIAGASDYMMKDNLTRLGPAIEREVREARVRRERRQAQLDLRDSEAKYRDLYDSAPSPFFTVSAEEGLIQDCNQAAGLLIGLSPSQIRGKPVLDLYADTPRGKERARKIFEGFKAGDAVHNAELQMKRAAGDIIDISLSVYPKKDESGKVVESRSIAIDITERKRLRAQVAQSDRLASMGMLAAGVAHEINNPLAYVLYNLESMSKDLPQLAAAMRRCLGTIPEAVGEDQWARHLGTDRELLNPTMLDDLTARFKDALEGANRIRDIVRGLGTFSRVEKDRMVPCSLMHSAEAAVNMVYNEIKYRARLVKEYGKTSMIMANDGRLSQVFLNLLINAAHAINEGNVDENEIRIRIWQEGQEILAEVRDTGRGISVEHLDHLFEPFFTTKARGVGTGLGLSISKNIITEHGGKIEVTSKVDEGTRFLIRLPANMDTGHDEVARPLREDALPEMKGRILVVDDEPGIRRTMVRVFRGHEVITADSGESGQKVLESDQSFDVILCDMMMPTMSGVELHEWLTANHPVLAERLIFITGGAFTPRARQYLEAVDNIRIDKPFDPVNLRKIVAKIIREARSAKQDC